MELASRPQEHRTIELLSEIARLSAPDAVPCEVRQLVTSNYIHFPFSLVMQSFAASVAEA